MIRRYWPRLVIAAFCAMMTFAIMAFVSSPLFIAGSRPVPIWGPALSGGIVLAILSVSVAGILLAPGRNGLLLAASIWLILLAILTHRVADKREDGITDLWLSISFGTSLRYAETDPDLKPCRIGPIEALCVEREGQRFRTLTFIPFAPMHESPGDHRLEGR